MAAAGRSTSWASRKLVIDGPSPESAGDYGSGAAHPKGSLATERIAQFRVPLGTEEAYRSTAQQFEAWFGARVTKWALDSDRLPFYDDVDHPTFFNSLAEAAGYFYGSLYPHLRLLPINFVELFPGKDAFTAMQLSFMVFNGPGQWFLKAVEWDPRGQSSWADREASAGCLPPQSAMGVVDLSHLAEYEVRPGYERYGGAAFFDVMRHCVAIWIEPEKRMYVPPSADAGPDVLDWSYASWRLRVSLYYYSFTIEHLTVCHWVTANCLTQGVRETLDPTHHVRRLAWSFCHGVISINSAAAVNLAGERGAVSRGGAITTDGVHRLMVRAGSNFLRRYETFEQFIVRKGHFGKGAPDDLKELFRETSPYDVWSDVEQHRSTESVSFDMETMVADGLSLWKSYKKMIDAYLACEYLPDDPSERTGSMLASRMKSVTDDEQLVALWERVRTAAMGDEVPLALPPLSRDALRDYLVHAFFYSTAVHELLGNIFLDVTVPTNVSTKILPKRHFSLERPPQATVNDWMQINCICAATNCIPTKGLIDEMERLETVFQNAWVYRGAVDHMFREEKIIKEFREELEVLAKRIDVRNEGFAQHPAGWMRHPKRAHEGGAIAGAFGTLNPRRMDVSVSM